MLDSEERQGTRTTRVADGAAHEQEHRDQDMDKSANSLSDAHGGADAGESDSRGGRHGGEGEAGGSGVEAGGQVSGVAAERLVYRRTWPQDAVAEVRLRWCKVRVGIALTRNGEVAKA